MIEEFKIRVLKLENNIFGVNIEPGKNKGIVNRVEEVEKLPTVGAELKAKREKK